MFVKRRVSQFTYFYSLSKCLFLKHFTNASNMSIQSASSLDDIVSRPNYYSFIRPRVIRFNNFPYRAAPSNGYPIRRVSTMVQRSSSFNQIPIKIRDPNVRAIQAERDHESRDLARLNDKFASYIETVHFLETHNKKLNLEADLLKNKPNESDKIRDMYQHEIQEAEKLINDTKKDKAKSELKARQGELEVDDVKKKYEDLIEKNLEDEKKIDNLCIQIASTEAEISLTKKRLSNLDSQSERYKNETMRYLEEIKRVSSELDYEILKRVQLQGEKDELNEEYQYIKKFHEIQLNELKEKILSEPRPDWSGEFKTNLAQAIRQIRNEFDKLNNERQNEFKLQYDVKIQTIFLKNKKPINPDKFIIEEEERKLTNNVKNQRRQIVDLKAKLADLEAKIRELEELKKREEEDGKDAIRAKEIEIANLNQQIKEIKKNLDELVRNNANLRDEIKRYHDLLDGSENKEGLKQILESTMNREMQNRNNY